MMTQRQVTYHDYEGIALDMDERSRMAATGQDLQGDDPAHHGLLTLGETVREASS